MSGQHRSNFCGEMEINLCPLGNHPFEDMAHSLGGHLQKDIELIFRDEGQEGVCSIRRAGRTRHHKLELPPEASWLDRSNFRGVRGLQR